MLKLDDILKLTTPSDAITNSEIAKSIREKASEFLQALSTLEEKRLSSTFEELQLNFPELKFAFVKSSDTGIPYSFYSKLSDDEWIQGFPNDVISSGYSSTIGTRVWANGLPYVLKLVVGPTSVDSKVWVIDESYAPAYYFDMSSAEGDSTLLANRGTGDDVFLNTLNIAPVYSLNEFVSTLATSSVKTSSSVPVGGSFCFTSTFLELSKTYFDDAKTPVDPTKPGVLMGVCDSTFSNYVYLIFDENMGLKLDVNGSIKNLNHTFNMLSGEQLFITLQDDSISVGSDKGTFGKYTFLPFTQNSLNFSVASGFSEIAATSNYAVASTVFGEPKVFSKALFHDDMKFLKAFPRTWKVSDTKDETFSFSLGEKNFVKHLIHSGSFENLLELSDWYSSGNGPDTLYQKTQDDNASLKSEILNASDTSSYFQQIRNGLFTAEQISFDTLCPAGYSSYPASSIASDENNILVCRTNGPDTLFTSDMQVVSSIDKYSYSIEKSFFFNGKAYGIHHTNNSGSHIYRLVYLNTDTSSWEDTDVLTVSLTAAYGTPASLVTFSETPVFFHNDSVCCVRIDSRIFVLNTTNDTWVEIVDYTKFPIKGDDYFAGTHKGKILCLKAVPTSIKFVTDFLYSEEVALPSVMESINSTKFVSVDDYLFFSNAGVMWCYNGFNFTAHKTLSGNELFKGGAENFYICLNSSTGEVKATGLDNTAFGVLMQADFVDLIPSEAFVVPSGAQFYVFVDKAIGKFIRVSINQKGALTDFRIKAQVESDIDQARSKFSQESMLSIGSILARGKYRGELNTYSIYVPYEVVNVNGELKEILAVDGAGQPTSMITFYVEAPKFGETWQCESTTNPNTKWPGTVWQEIYRYQIESEEDGVTTTHTFQITWKRTA